MSQTLDAATAEDRQRRVVRHLRAAGITEGQRIAVVAPSGSDLVCVVGGALRVGVVPVLVKPDLAPAERATQIADADVSAVVDGAVASRWLHADPSGVGTVELAPWPRARPMHFTSGTTGRAKGVWSGVLDDHDAAALAGEERELWGFEADDVHLVCSPLHHSAPLRFALATLLAGGSLVVPERFEPATVVGEVDEHRVTTTFCVPTHLQRMRSHFGDTAPTMASLRLVAHAGAPCPVPVKRWALATFPTGSVWEFYGSTEGQFTVCGPDDWLARPDSVGRARPGRTLTADADGQLWCRAPRHARFRYWGDEAATAAAWDGDAFTVGDLGRVDDGWVVLDGRRDDLVITGGINVYPAQVEQVLSRLEGVVEVAVFGTSDPEWGQRVCAAVVGEVSPEHVQAWARSELAGFQCPKTVLVVDEIPRNTMGKVQRHRLADQLGLVNRP